MAGSHLVVLDCDGTLVDSQAGIVDSMVVAFHNAGLPAPSAQDIRRIVGLTVETAVARLAPEADAETIERVGHDFREHFAELRRQLMLEEPLYPGALEAIAALKAQGAILAVATGKSRRGLIATLRLHGIEQEFAGLQTSSDAPSKPAPDMLFNLMIELDVRPERTVMVGDTSFDMVMAKAAKTHALGVAWGYHDRAELMQNGASEVLEDFTALPAAIRRLFGQAP